MDSAVLPQLPSSSQNTHSSVVKRSLLQKALLGGFTSSNMGSLVANAGMSATVVTPPDTVGQLSAIEIPDEEKLDLFEEVLTSIDGGNTAEPVLDDSIVTTTNYQNVTATPQINPALAQSQIQALADDTVPPSLSYPGTPSGRVPERSPGMVISAEVPGLATVEYEPSQEIPVEVEGFLERVAENPESMPQEIVINGNDIALNQHQPPKLAVVVLPISQEEEKLAHGKNPTWSVAWLVEWSHKIIKKFMGKVIYHPVQSTQEASST